MMVKKFEQLVRKKGMTQQELSEKMNVSSAAISNWETGRHYPDIDMLVELSHILNFSLDKLFNEDTQMVQDLATEQKKRQKKNGRYWVIDCWYAGISRCEFQYGLQRGWCCA